MEIELLIKNMKEIYPCLMAYIDSDEESEFNFHTLVKLLEELEIFDEKDQILCLFELISKISIHNHRSPTFFGKLSKLFDYLFQEQKPTIPFSELIQIFEKDKRLLLLFLEKRYLPFDEQSIHELISKKDPNGFKNKYYFFCGIKNFIDEWDKKQIEAEILKEFNDNIETFEEKCRIGENDSYVCSLIRQDSIKEFVTYVNRTNLSLLGRIKPSIFETNSFLIDNKPTLIEYAAFFGSIEIFNYLKLNRVSLNGSLWLYTVHSNNAEMIHLLEGNIVKPEDNTYEECFQEAIKCHFNNIADYIKDNLLLETEISDGNDEADLIDENASYITESYNFHYLPSNIEILDLISDQKNPFGFYLSILCFSIKSITIPSSVTTIGEKAFEECKSLKKIIIPSSVTSIGGSAFSECESLVEIAIPSSITSIENYTFNKCSSLVEISIPSSVKSIGIYAFAQCTALKSVTIPSSVTSIEMGSFTKCSSLKQVTIPSSITSIGENAFSECTSLKNITIPSSVKKIGGSAFSRCLALNSVSIPSSVASIGHHAFSECLQFEQITIPSSVKTIGNGAFSNCSSLIDFTIETPSSLTSFGEDTFIECISLKNVSLPSSMTSLGNGTFQECTALEQITIPSSLTSIGQRVFNKCESLEQISIPSSVTIIGKRAFAECSSLVQLIFEKPSSVASIDDYAFSKCESLKIVTIPQSVTTVSREAFVGCSGLEQISIPSSTQYYYMFGDKVNVIRT